MRPSHTPQAIEQRSPPSSGDAGKAGCDAFVIPPLVWAIAALAVAIRVGISVSTHFTWEDSLITLRYAENLARGHGFVYNPGERILGTTTPLYALFLALVARLGLPPLAFGKGINILADGALCLVVYRWLCLLRQETAGRVAAFWIAVSPLHIRWAISGMETSLVTLCSAVVWLAYAQRRYRTAYGVLAVLFLLRWDSVLLLAVLTAAIVWRERRLPLRELGLFALLILPWLLFATWYFGSPIPVTGFAKMTVYGWRRREVFLPELRKLLFLCFGPPYFLPTLAAGIGLVCAWRERWTLLGPPLGWFALYWSAFLLSKVLLFPWYVIPPLPVYELLASVGAARIARRVGASWPRRWQQAALLTVIGLALLLMVWPPLAACRETQSIEDHLRRPIGLWLKAHSAPTDRIMLEPIGYIGYYSERPVLDVVGLVTPKVLPAYNPQNIAPMWNIAQTFRPEWCVLRPGEIQHIHDAARLAGRSWEDDYELIKTFAYTPRRNREPIVFSIYRRKRP